MDTGKHISIGGAVPAPVGSANTVADFLEEWVRVTELDGFNIGYMRLRHLARLRMLLSCWCRN